MARKAKPPPKSRQPSLDDPRWRPIIAVHKRLVEHDGDPHAAALDLTAALTGGELRHAKLRETRRLQVATYRGRWV